MERAEILDTVCIIFNAIKRTEQYSSATVTEVSYLGGDLGLDSIEMLEAWVDIQKKLDIFIDDEEMIDILQVSQVLDLIKEKLQGK